MMLARAGFEAEELADFKGLAKRSPWFAVVMTMLMFSLAGVPPMMGFMAKWAVLQAVIATGQVWLAVVAVMFSLIGAFYYLRVVKMMWFDEPADASPIVDPVRHARWCCRSTASPWCCWACCRARCWAPA